MNATWIGGKWDQHFGWMVARDGHSAATPVVIAERQGSEVQIACVNGQGTRISPLRWVPADEVTA